MKFVALLLCFVGISICRAGDCSAEEKPNIVVIFADDMGYGDVSCLNPEAKFTTPNLDALAAGGLKFTDAHASSGVCTPSRYSLLTGRYCWRSRMRRGVLGGYGRALIQNDRETAASILKRQGYDTACIGKWHLGMNFPTTDGQKAIQKGGDTVRYVDGEAVIEKGGEMTCNVAWSERITRSPTSNGFDHFFGINGSLDMPPYVFIEDDRFTATPTEIKAFPRPGMAHKDFEAVNVLPELANRAVKFIKNQDHATPFFLYLPMTGPHTPIVPTKEFRGKSGIGPYGDFCMQVDHHVGQVMQALRDQGIEKNTLVLFSSDNGCEHHAYKQFRNTGHNSSGMFRGVKRDLWEGGHRVPTFVHWPAVIKPGRVWDKPVCLTDVMPTFAEITGHRLSENSAEDGVSWLPILKGHETTKSAREGIVHHSLYGKFAIRSGDWVLIDAPSGSDRDDEPKWYAKDRGCLTHDQPAELFDLSTDAGQKKNVYAEHPELAKKMKALLTETQKPAVKRDSSKTEPK